MFGGMPFGDMLFAGGAAGEPHFVGFDGVRFSYHGMPGYWYRLWDGGGLQLDGFFDLEPIAAKYPTFTHTTFITQLRARSDGREQCLGLQEDWQPLVTLLAADMPAEVREAWARGIPPELKDVEGDLVGALLLEDKRVAALVTCLSFRAEFRFLNVAFSVASALDILPSGIIGQTMRPESQRIPNKRFRIAGI